MYGEVASVDDGVCDGAKVEVVLYRRRNCMRSYCVALCVVDVAVLGPISCRRGFLNEVGFLRW